MTQTFTVTIDASLSDRDVTKVSQALRKATAKWFKQGYQVTVEADA